MIPNQIFCTQIKSSPVIQSWFKSNHDLDLSITARLCFIFRYIITKRGSRRDGRGWVQESVPMQLSTDYILRFIVNSSKLTIDCIVNILYCRILFPVFTLRSCSIKLRLFGRWPSLVHINDPPFMLGLGDTRYLLYRSAQLIAVIREAPNGFILPG